MRIGALPGRGGVESYSSMLASVENNDVNGGRARLLERHPQCKDARAREASSYRSDSNVKRSLGERGYAELVD